MKLRLCRADVGLRTIRSRPFFAVGALGEGLASGVVAEGDDVVDRSVAGHGEETGFLGAPGKADQRGTTFDQGARTCARWR